MNGNEEPNLISPDDAAFDASTAAAAATAIPPGPPPSSNAPGAFQEPLERSGSAEAAPTNDDPAPMAPKAFDDRYKQPFTGLMYLGHLEENFSIWGHVFRIVTPSRLERLQAGELHAPYLGTLAAEIGYETVMVAAFLTEVDGHELPKPVITDPSNNAVRDRFKWVTENLKEPVIGLVYEHVLRLDESVREVMAAMGEASG
jgi:hypothetical protein